MGVKVRGPSYMSDWNYFRMDMPYSNLLKERLATGVEMDSARALAVYLDKYCDGDLRILDFGSGPGHYYPVLKRIYSCGSINYTGVDIDESSIRFGSEYFQDDPSIKFKIGSVLEPHVNISDDINCIISANVLPHVPTIVPLMQDIGNRKTINYFIFRLLIGNECVMIKKHLSDIDFDGMFDRNFQFNNLYSLSYIKYLIGSAWDITLEEDIYDPVRLDAHHIPQQDNDVFYSNRVSRLVGDMIFKGDIYMPWKFVVGRRVA